MSTRLTDAELEGLDLELQRFEELLPTTAEQARWNDEQNPTSGHWEAPVKSGRASREVILRAVSWRHLNGTNSDARGLAHLASRLLDSGRALILEIQHDRALMALQWRRTREADVLWQKAHPEEGDVWPDLGELVGWLVEQRVTPELRTEAVGAAAALRDIAAGMRKRQADEVERAKATDPDAVPMPHVDMLAAHMEGIAERLEAALPAQVAP